MCELSVGVTTTRVPCVVVSESPEAPTGSGSRGGAGARGGEMVVAVESSDAPSLFFSRTFKCSGKARCEGVARRGLLPAVSDKAAQKNRAVNGRTCESQTLKGETGLVAAKQS